jgi:sec-independent protein translocase protein TatA
MPALGPWELVIILLIVVVIFGAGRLAEIGGAVGKSVREFRNATHDEETKAAAAASVAAAKTTTPVAASTSAPAPASTATAAPAENKCPSCATVNPPGQVFCGQCGTRLTKAA